MTPLSDFPALYAAHAAHVRAVVSSILRSCPARVPDVTQEVWLRAWAKRGTFRGAASPRTWLHRIAVNTALMELRKERKDRGAESLEELVRRCGEDWRTPLPPALRVRDRQLESVAERRDLERAFRRLSLASRDALVAHHAEGKTYSEMAAERGRSRLALRCVVFRARQRLQRELGAK